MTEVKVKDHRRTIIRSLAVRLLIIVAEIIHGIVRAIALVPMVGELRSNQIGVFSGSAIILAVAYFTIRWIGAASRQACWQVPTGMLAKVPAIATTRSSLIWNVILFVVMSHVFACEFPESQCFP